MLLHIPGRISGRYLEGQVIKTSTVRYSGLKQAYCSDRKDVCFIAYAETDNPQFHLVFWHFVYVSTFWLGACVLLWIYTNACRTCTHAKTPQTCYSLLHIYCTPIININSIPINIGLFSMFKLLCFTNILLKPTVKHSFFLEDSKMFICGRRFSPIAQNQPGILGHYLGPRGSTGARNKCSNRGPPLTMLHAWVSRWILVRPLEEWGTHIAPPAPPSQQPCKWIMTTSTEGSGCRKWRDWATE